MGMILTHLPMTLDGLSRRGRAYIVPDVPGYILGSTRIYISRVDFLRSDPRAKMKICRPKDSSTDGIMLRIRQIGYEYRWLLHLLHLGTVGWRNSGICTGFV